MCQPNPSGIRYFKPILSSFKNCDFLSSPYREWVGTGQWSLKFRLDKTAENIKNVMFQPTCLNIQFLDLWRKKKPVAVPLDVLPERRTMTMIPEISAQGSLIPAATLGPLLLFGYRCSEGGSCRPLNHMRQSHSKSRSKSPAYPYFWIRMIYIWRFSHWVILVVRIY